MGLGYQKKMVKPRRKLERKPYIPVPKKDKDKQNSDGDFHYVDYDFHENEHIETISDEREVDVFQHVVINEHSYCWPTNTPNCVDC